MWSYRWIQTFLKNMAIPSTHSKVVVEISLTKLVIFGQICPVFVILLHGYIYIYIYMFQLLSGFVSALFIMFA
jgi:hypothetical protein